MTVRNSPRTLVAIALLSCVSIVSCGGQASQQRPSSSPSSQGIDYGQEGEASQPDGESSGDERQEIGRLFQQIGEYRVSLSMSREPGQEAVEAMGSVTPQAAGSEAHAAKTKTCKEVCRISEAICSNAKLICEIADDLGQDLWASEKCSSANASCEEASEHCSRCVSAE